MIYKKLQNNLLYLTNSDPNSPIITLSGDYKDIWEMLEKSPKPSLTGKPGSVNLELLNFLTALENGKFLPNELSLDGALQSLGSWKSKSLEGKFEIEKGQEPLDISAKWVEDAYEEWYCMEVCMTARPPKK